MSKPKTREPSKLVWRISQGAPLGEWVQRVPAAIHGPATDLPEVSYGSWVTSSFDLLDGTDVTEDPDTVPGDLLDDLFAPKPSVPKT